MKAVVLEEQGVINVREVPDVKDPGPGELRIAPTPWAYAVLICITTRTVVLASMLLSSQ